MRNNITFGTRVAFYTPKTGYSSGEIVAIGRADGIPFCDILHNGAVISLFPHNIIDDEEQPN